MKDLKLNVAGVGNDGGMLVRLDDVKAIFQSQAERIAELEKETKALKEQGQHHGQLGQRTGQLGQHHVQLGQRTGQLGQHHGKESGIGCLKYWSKANE